MDGGPAEPESETDVTWDSGMKKASVYIAYEKKNLHDDANINDRIMCWLWRRGNRKELSPKYEKNEDNTNWYCGRSYRFCRYHMFYVPA